MVAIAEFSNQAVAAMSAETALARDRSDQALVRAIAGGDKHAMRTLYARHHLRVYRFIVRLTNDASLAEDLLSEAFLGAWRQAGHFKSKTPLTTSRR